MPLYKYLLKPECPKICPLCLTESGYCRLIWDIALATVCPTHRCLLIDYCQQCESYIPNNRSQVSTCVCGYDYRLSTVTKVQDDELSLTRRLHFLCGLAKAGNGSTSARQSQNDPTLKLSLSALATLHVFFAGQYQGVLTTAGRRYSKSESN